MASEYVAASVQPDRRAAASVERGDFFTWGRGAEKFELGYDYTFMTALDPSMRKTWAASWGELLQPGGQLVTVRTAPAAAWGHERGRRAGRAGACVRLCPRRL